MIRNSQLIGKKDQNIIPTGLCVLKYINCCMFNYCKMKFENRKIVQHFISNVLLSDRWGLKVSCSNQVLFNDNMNRDRKYINTSILKFIIIIDCYVFLTLSFENYTTEN